MGIVLDLAVVVVVVVVVAVAFCNVRNVDGLIIETNFGGDGIVVDVELVGREGIIKRVRLNIVLFLCV